MTGLMFVTINRFEWGNPHNQIYFEVTDEKSVVSRWSVETKLLALMSERYRTRKSFGLGGRDHGFVHAKNSGTVGILQKNVLTLFSASNKPFAVWQSYSSDAWVRVKITPQAIIDRKIFGGEN
jgi:hypothetical protein